MNFRRVRVVCIVLAVIAAPLAALADDAVPSPLKAPAHVAKAKKVKPAAPAGDMADIKFSDPSAPPAGGAKPSKPASSSADSKVAPVPVGSPSLDLKWHAENRVNNPYWEPWVPNGQGQSVEAGVKFGF
ncbi:hypothetical protein [Methylocapsa sp. S129]|uniref:hypothetical protein n=1 Tax=Methylocapsa sp. S129 TaxID=1641869 RepID=UPI00131D9CE2|nr:hypothetical protein [Methylocapsa sp. S129]